MARENHIKVTPSSFAVPTRHSAGSPVKESPFSPSQAQRSLLLKLFKYSSLLAKRIYSPIRPIVNPLLKKIKLVYWLIALVIIGVIGNWQYWQEKKDYLAAIDKKTEIETEIKSWETILNEKPDYRDVYLKLGLLNWMVNNQEQAKENWERASYLDPNDKVVQEVGRIISSVLLF